MYDYYLGGKDNFPADRDLANQILKAMPEVRVGAHENRAFMHRAVRFLAEEAGIRQFLDVGTGIPTSPNLHEVAQNVAPDARVVYADSDPVVLAQARALLTSSAEGATGYIDADLRDPGSILAAPELRDTLDLSQPVALCLVAILHFVRDEEHPGQIVSTLLGALPAGSYLVLSHGTADLRPDADAVVTAYSHATAPLVLRSHGQVRGFFDELELIDPGLVQVSCWRPPQHDDRPREVSVYGGVGRKPDGGHND